MYKRLEDLKAAAETMVEHITHHYARHHDETPAFLPACKLAIELFEEPELKYALVYHDGVASVFSVDCFNLRAYGREAERVFHGGFSVCENFARGLVEAGCRVAIVSCDAAVANSSVDSLKSARWQDTGCFKFEEYASFDIGFILGQKSGTYLGK